MRCRRRARAPFLSYELAGVIFLISISALAAFSAQISVSAQVSSSSSSPAKAESSQRRVIEPALNPGSVSSGVYRGPPFGLACKIPAGWVLRTDEMNLREGGDQPPDGNKAATDAKRGQVLLAAFSRPPEVRAQDVNASILIAVESAAVYPGLKDAAQYFGPVTEVAKAKGFEIVEEPYEFVIGAKTLVRGDFQKDVGTRVMRQSTLVMLSRGYAVSFTFIGGTEDEVEELVQGLSFAGAKTGR
jgi:hypothetical protein